MGPGDSSVSMHAGSVAPISTSKGAGQGITPHMFLYPDKEITNTSILQYGNGEAGAAGLAEIVQVGFSMLSADSRGHEGYGSTISYTYMASQGSPVIGDVIVAFVQKLLG